jgi:hypothetical protein
MPCVSLKWRLGGVSASCGLRCLAVDIVVKIFLNFVGTMPATAIGSMAVTRTVTRVVTTFVLMFVLMVVLLVVLMVVLMVVTMVVTMVETMFVLMFDVKIVAMIAKVVVFFNNWLIQGLRWLFVMPFLIVNYC